MGQTFVILEERADGGNSSMMSMVVRFPSFEKDRFPSREAAETNVKVLEAKNARSVEATKRRRKYKTLPAIYTVIECTPEEEERISQLRGSRIGGRAARCT